MQYPPQQQNPQPNYPPQQQQFGYNQQNDRSQPQRGPPPQQANYNAPASGQSGGGMNNYPSQQEGFSSQDRFAPANRLQRSDSRDNNALGYNNNTNNADGGPAGYNPENRESIIKFIKVVINKRGWRKGKKSSVTK